MTVHVGARNFFPDFNPSLGRCGVCCVCVSERERERERKRELKLQYFGHLMRRADSLVKTLMLGNIDGGEEGDDRGRDG